MMNEDMAQGQINVFGGYLTFHSNYFYNDQGRFDSEAHPREIR